MKYIILILIVLVSVFVLKMNSNKEFFSVLACPRNPYIIDRTPYEYIFSGNHKIIQNSCNKENKQIEHFTTVGSNSISRIIWIYYPFNKNSREWLDWGSRLNYTPNPELFDMCVQNLKDKTGWNIVVLNQTNMNKYIKIPAGLEDNELFIQAKILYKYGGFWAPAYSFPIKNLDTLRNKVDKIIMPYIPDLHQVLPIMCISGLKIWSQMSDYIVTNPNRQSDFSDFQYLYYIANCNKVNLVDGRVFGMLDKNGSMITFLNLVSDNPPELSNETFLVCINRIEEERLNTQYINYNGFFNKLIDHN
jgi:hypothetical protein